MSDCRAVDAVSVSKPQAKKMSHADLPPPDISRWVAHRKAQVVTAVNEGLLSVREACKRYSLTVEELTSWQRSIDCEGLVGLRATHVQQQRRRTQQQARHTLRVPGVPRSAPPARWSIAS